jgi:site-specific DNA recombinase
MPSTNGRGTKRAILYARVSTDEQARSGFSLAQQLEALRGYAAREGCEVLEEVQDAGQSGASLERPGMDRVRDLVAAGGVSVVLAQDRDRFTREPAYHYFLKREFDEHDTKMRALNDRGDDSPEGELTDGILDQLAKYERAKIAERTRRGKLKKVSEGKILAGNCADYGFNYNAARDGYVVDEETMLVVRRIFRMIGVEGASIRGVVATLNREGVKSPGAPWSRSGRWGTRTIRENIINDDVYRPHTYEETKVLVSTEVAARLNSSKLYGIWWYNRTRTKITQVSTVGQNGREYVKRAECAPKPREEWVAVPVPDSGVPREWVDAAREAIKDNRVPSSAGHRFWELSGGILRCGGCGNAMMTNGFLSRGKKMLFYYRCPTRLRDRGACAQPKGRRADEVEPLVWEFVSEILTDPEQLRSDLEKVIELECEELRGDPDREAKAWLEKLTEIGAMRSGYQEMAAKGLITFEELEEKLLGLEESRKTAERELQALRGHRERLEELEQDKDSLLDSYAGMAPEALNSLTPEERHRVYKLLRLKVMAHVDGTVELSGALLSTLDVGTSETACS